MCFKKQLGLVIVGGGEAASKAIRTIENENDFDVLAVMCESEELRSLVPPAKRKNSLNELVDVPGVKAVYIATPPGSHLQIANFFLTNGKHVLIEKPLASDLAGVPHLDVPDGLVAGIALKKRFGDWIPFFTELFGVELEELHLEFMWNISRPLTLWRFQPKISGGGVLMDLGPHILDLAEFLCGCIASVNANAIFGESPNLIDDRVQVNLKHQSGAVTDIILDWAKNSRNYSFKAVAKNQSLYHYREDRKDDKLIIKNGDRQIELQTDSQNEYRGLFFNFAEAIRGHPHTLPTHQDGIHNLKMLNNVHDSIRLRKTVSITGYQKGKI